MLDYQIAARRDRAFHPTHTMSNAYTPLAIGVMGMLAISVMTAASVFFR